MPPLRRFVMNIGLAVLAVAVLISTGNAVQETIFLKRQEQVLKLKFDSLLEEKQRIEQELGALNLTGTVERRAKEQLNLKYPGEEVVLVGESHRSEEDRATTTALPWWKRLFLRIAP